MDSSRSGHAFARRTARAAIKEEPVTYKDGETTMKGFVVHDERRRASSPAFVLVHEWWGHHQAHAQ